MTVKRAERDAEGQVKHKEVETYRNRWVIEKREFFEARNAAAQMVRDEAIRAQDAVRKHPELAGTYLNLERRSSPQAPEGSGGSETIRVQVRSALADDIERGEPLQPVRLRERAVRKLVEDPERVR